METTGAILKHRIKEMGYRQLDFAEACQISGTSLKKYMKDQLPFSVELLKKFAELLDCSTDYLLGQAETPQKEIQSLKEQTHLSDGALLFLKINNHDFCQTGEDETVRKESAEEDLITASLLLEDPEIMLLLKRWLYFDENDEQYGTPSGFTNFVELSGVFLEKEDFQGVLFSRIQERLCTIKTKFRELENKSDVLTREVSEDAKKRTGEWLNS
ncbi:MAG: helix-turn-helix domain-containing protein [Bacteroides sp.]|nr:helix-turn-helix domain-containing protein [Eubacterium sp.]MCM1419142.1 helix-turn-helix domain-containing protein [Roseburia sp.]MCM1463229.1 helix-turn-helix domain-containing protein [Bacteroides sp.]